MYLSDYHFHTRCSSDSQATLAQQAEAAMAAGLREICVTDHWNLLDQAGNRLPTVYGWEPSLEQWKKLRNRWPGALELRLGVEVGNGVLDPAAVDASLELPELDFVIGSLHSQSAAAGGRGIFTVAHECVTKEDGVAILDDYMDMLEELTQTRGWDVLGHVIYPLRYIPEEYGLDLRPWWDRLAEIFRSVIAQGKGIDRAIFAAPLLSFVGMAALAVLFPLGSGQDWLLLAPICVAFAAIGLGVGIAWPHILTRIF